MSRNDDFRIRPGRIRSTRTPQTKSFLAQALRAAQKAGGLSHGGMRSGSFGRGRAASVAAARLLNNRARGAMVKARVVRRMRSPGALRAHIGYLKRDGDVWQADGEGYYDVQRPEFSAALLRARFRTNGEGKFFFRSIMPSFYPIPSDGPVGEMLKATGRHPNRPAHIHFMITASDYESLITHVFDAESPYLDSDAVFGVKNSLIADFSKSAIGPVGTAGATAMPVRHLKYDFGLKLATKEKERR